MPKVKKKENKLTKLIMDKGKTKEKHKSILEIDYMANHYLELSDDKQSFIMSTIKDMNKTVNKRKIRNKEYFSALNDNLRGKLFYISYKDGKYLRMKDLEKLIDKKTVIEFVKEIETGQEYAWELIDNIGNPQLKDFFYGIFTYLYF